MKVLELVESAKAANASAFQGTPDKRSAKMIAAALRDLGKRLEEADDGRVTVAGFGSFVVREKDGDEDKRIISGRPPGARAKRARSGAVALLAAQARRRRPASAEGSAWGAGGFTPVRSGPSVPPPPLHQPAQARAVQRDRPRGGGGVLRGPRRARPGHLVRPVDRPRRAVQSAEDRAPTA